MYSSEGCLILLQLLSVILDQQDIMSCWFPFQVFEHCIVLFFLFFHLLSSRITLQHMVLDCSLESFGSRYARKDLSLLHIDDRSIINALTWAVLLIGLWSGCSFLKWVVNLTQLASGTKSKVFSVVGYFCIKENPESLRKEKHYHLDWGVVVFS